MGRVIRVEFRFNDAAWADVRANLSERSIRHVLHKGGIDNLSLASLIASVDTKRIKAIAERLAEKKPRKGRRKV